MEAGSAARSFKGSDCCARRARRGAGGGRVRADLCAQSVRAGADRSEQRTAFQQAAGRHDAFDPAGRTPPTGRRRRTGFDSTGSIAKKRKAKRKPGSRSQRRARARVVLRGSPQQARRAPQIAARAVYANATSLRMRRCADRCRPTPIRTSRSACGSAASCCGRRSRSAMARQQSEPHAERAALELHAGAAGGADQVAWPVHELGATLRGSYFAYDNLPSVESTIRRHQGVRPLRLQPRPALRGRGPLPARHRQSGQPEPAGRPRQAADLHHLGRDRRSGAALQPPRPVGEGQRRPHHLPEFRADRRNQRQQRGPQLQSVPRARPRQLRIHSRASSRSSRSMPTSASTTATPRAGIRTP